jgi:hypothetical protein
MRILPLLLLSVLAVGCGATTVEVARGTLTTAAVAATQADRLFADAYEVEANYARDSSSTQAEKDQKMAGWTLAADKFERYYAAATASLVAAEVALDGFERTGETSYWDEALACAAATLRDMARVLEERGLKIPPALAKVLSLSEGLTCAEKPR